MAKHKDTPSERPIKPWPDFPLFPHATGRWAKKIGGKLHYFGPWSDPNGAYERYLVRTGDRGADGGTIAGKVAGKGSARPLKPWPGYPLYPHPSGQWAKKIRRKTYYFGTDAEAAYKLYQDEKDDLEAGRAPKPRTQYHLTVKDMVNLCLTLKESKQESGELRRRTYTTSCG